MASVAWHIPTRSTSIRMIEPARIFMEQLLTKVLLATAGLNDCGDPQPPLSGTAHVLTPSGQGGKKPANINNTGVIIATEILAFLVGKFQPWPNSNESTDRRLLGKQNILFSTGSSPIVEVSRSVNVSLEMLRDDTCDRRSGQDEKTGLEFERKPDISSERKAGWKGKMELSGGRMPSSPGMSDRRTLKAINATLCSNLGVGTWTPRPRNRSSD